MKLPSLSQWKKIFSLFSRKENYFILGLVILALFSLLTWFVAYRFFETTTVSVAGGSYSEGLVGSPHYLNPILAQANDVDQDLTKLVFSGLMKYDATGQLIPDLAEQYSIGEKGRIYDFFLKKNVLWHDGQPLNADDVVFTIQTIQNPAFHSPLMNNWLGVEVEKIDDWTVRFRLSSTYGAFLNNLTVGLLPKHLWAEVAPAEFSLIEYNLKPIGTGPYQFDKLDRNNRGLIKTIYFKSNRNYYFGQPYIEKLSLHFYLTEDDLISAYNKGEVEGLAFISAQNKSKLRNLSRKINLHQLLLPRYFAVFFNQSKSAILADKTVRLALNYATNKEEIIKEIFQGEAEPVNSPIPGGVFGSSSEIKIYDFAPEHAANILEADGWVINEETGWREKSDQVLKITLTTTTWPELQAVAKLIQKQWQAIGVQTELQFLDALTIQEDYIQPREYQAVLFGEVLSAGPDLFAFWHSGQKRDPGLNLALYDNQAVDKLLMEIRESLEPKTKLDKFKELQELIVDEAPVVFLYNPFYLYPVNKKVKGLDAKNILLPSDRFSDIANWYIKTKRIKKI